MQMLLQRALLRAAGVSIATFLMSMIVDLWRGTALGPEFARQAFQMVTGTFMGGLVFFMLVDTHEHE